MLGACRWEFDWIQVTWLNYLSIFDFVIFRKAKQIFKKCGDQFGRDTSKWAVVASNDINEEALKQFNQVGHSIDVFGIGTNLVTC